MRRVGSWVTGALAAAAAGLGWAAGCSVEHDDCANLLNCPGESTGAGGQGIGGGASSSGATSSNTASTGTMAECVADSACDDGEPCTADACVEGTCVFTPDDDAVPTDGKPCTTDSCVGGVETHVNVAAGVACGQGEGLKCDGMGSCVGCVVAEDCAPSMSECFIAVCMADQTCGLAPVQDGTPLSKQVIGDCVTEVCAAGGSTKLVIDETDVPVDDLNVCTVEVCVGDAPMHPIETAGMPCDDGYCNAAGKCVACVDDAGCGQKAGGYCFDEECYSCADGSPKGSETDVDCGGPDCPKCGLGKGCMQTSDCAVGTCVGGKCTLCVTNGVKDGSETDVDCGGGFGICAPGKLCGSGADCTSGSCAEGRCCNVACNGPCKTCNAPGNPGTCLPLAMGKDDTSAPDTCSGATVCSCTNPISGKICDASTTATCVADNGKASFGEVCGAGCFNAACRSGVCRSNIGDLCANDAECWSLRCDGGVCTVPCVNNPACGSVMCNATGYCPLTAGKPCFANADCASQVCNAATKTCQ